MSRGCKICKSNHLKAVDQAIINGKTLQEIADKYHFHVSTISRHKAHIADKIRKACAVADAQDGATVMQRIEDLLQKANDLLDKAELSGDIRTALIAIRETRGCLELLAKATGQFTPETILIQVEPVLNTLVLILKEEIKDDQVIKRVAERLKAIET